MAKIRLSNWCLFNLKTEKSYALRRGYNRVGKSHSAHIILHHESVEEKHACIILTRNKIALHDTSRRGTSVVQGDNESKTLKNDIIILGEYDGIGIGIYLLMLMKLETITLSPTVARGKGSKNKSGSSDEQRNSQTIQEPNQSILAPSIIEEALVASPQYEPKIPGSQFIPIRSPSPIYNPPTPKYKQTNQ